ncbi:MAG: hypothetical protein ACE366_24845 [Bradymonadia bacterium]
MKAQHTPSRRAFLLESVLAAGGLALLAAGCSGKHDPGPVTPEVTALASSREAADAAARIGNAWLETQKDKITYATLVDSVLGSERPANLATDAKALKARVAERHTADLEVNRITDLGGWVFSFTEVRLYALVALSRQSKG